MFACVHARVRTLGMSMLCARCAVIFAHHVVPHLVPLLPAHTSLGCTVATAWVMYREGGGGGGNKGE